MPFTQTLNLAEILAIARIHPFFASDVKYPPDADAIHTARYRATLDTTEPKLSAQPLLWRSNLYGTINRLVDDTNPQNTFRQGVYASTTGGGTGSKPLLFLTDVHENRRARANFGRFLRVMGVVSSLDWVVSTHTAGELYRSLDLTLEILENAGATVLAAGQHMSPAEVVQLMINYHANVLSGESSQIVSIVHHIATLAEAERGRLHIEKIIYTSEGLAPPQKAHIREILGNIPIFSILGSAEAGPYALSCPHLTGNDWETVPYGDFVFDTRMTRLEILPLSLTMHDSHLEPVEDGQLGLVVQTSLTRLRNPLVRYVTGDVGSLHELPKDSRILVPDEELKHLRIFRLYGRDRRFSFEWDGNYLEFKGLDAMMNDPQLGVLQWQIVLGKREPSKEGLLEVRVLRSNAETNTVSENNLIERIETFFHVFSGNRDRFKLAMLKDDSGFARSEGGRKIVKFLDR